MTNSERRVTLCPAFRSPRGEARDDWAIFASVGRRLGEAEQFPFTNSAIEIHPRDAGQLGIQDDDWVEVRSRRGKARFPAKVTQAIAPGTVFVPMHWGALWADQAEANALTHPKGLCCNSWC